MEKQAKKKGLSIAGIALCLVLLCGVVGFVVYAAVYQSFDMGGKVSFEAEGVNATVEATGWTNCTIGGAEYSDEQTILPKIVYSTDKGLVDTSGVSAWEDVDVVITSSPATLTFKVTNDSSDTALDVEIGTISYKNESTNKIVIESSMESETVEAGESISITITFTVSDTAYGAEISDFNIPVTLTKSETVVATVGDFSYTLNESNSTATVTAYTGTETYVTIPSTIDVDDSSVSGEAIVSANATTTYSVTAIKSTAFSGENCESITNLYIPSTIVSIADEAFSGCKSLVSIINKSSISISVGDYGTPASGVSVTETSYTVTLNDIDVSSSWNCLDGGTRVEVTPSYSIDDGNFVEFTGTGETITLEVGSKIVIKGYLSDSYTYVNFLNISDGSETYTTGDYSANATTVTITVSSNLSLSITASMEAPYMTSL